MLQVEDKKKGDVQNSTMVQLVIDTIEWVVAKAATRRRKMQFGF